MSLKQTSLYSDASLKAYWPFEEISGTTLYDIKGTNHLTASNTGILSADGKFSRGLFTGPSAYNGNITYAGNDLKPSGAFSLAWWMKTSDTGTYNMTWGTASWQNPTDTGFWIDYRNGAIGLHTADNGGNTSYGAIGSVNNGVWRHLVCAFTGVAAGNSMKLYVDGSYVSAIGFSRAIAFSATSYFWFGQGMVNTYMDDGAFFAKELSATEAAILYNSPPDPKNGGNPLFFQGGGLALS